MKEDFPPSLIDMVAIDDFLGGCTRKWYICKKKKLTYHSERRFIDRVGLKMIHFKKNLSHHFGKEIHWSIWSIFFFFLSRFGVLCFFNCFDLILINTNSSFISVNMMNLSWIATTSFMWWRLMIETKKMTVCDFVEKIFFVFWWICREEIYI